MWDRLLDRRTLLVLVTIEMDRVSGSAEQTLSK